MYTLYSIQLYTMGPKQYVDTVKHMVILRPHLTIAIICSLRLGFQHNLF